MSTYKIIFIHGYTSSSKGDWYSQIAQELEKLDIDFSIPDLPGGEYPHAEEWLEVMHKVVTQGVAIARDLNADLMSVTGRDHFSGPENAPYVFEILRKELGF